MFNERPKLYRVIPWIIGGVALAAVAAFFFGFFVMLLWNWLMPDIFGLGTITYWQAWGLVLLSHLLIKAGGHHPDHHFHDESWKQKFRRKFHERFHKPEKGAHTNNEESTETS